MLWRSNDCRGEAKGRGGQLVRLQGKKRQAVGLTPSHEDTRSFLESGEKVREEMVSLGGSRTTSEADIGGGGMKRRRG